MSPPGSYASGYPVDKEAMAGEVAMAGLGLESGGLKIRNSSHILHRKFGYLILILVNPSHHLLKT